MTGHYDHHMGKNQDSNWCVTRPWFDWVMGTRVRYAFSPAETKRRLKALRRALLKGKKLELTRLTLRAGASNQNSLGAA
jgi:sterol desaturase/sphingolipid hydroxylase (fatty acid hydroxylase superfamily)